MTKKLLGEIFMAIPLPLVLLSADDGHFIITKVNTAYLELTGLEESEMNGKSIFDFLPILDDDKTSDELEISLTSVVQSRTTHTMRGRALAALPDQGLDSLMERQVNYENIPVFDEQQQLVSVIHAVIDVTNHKPKLFKTYLKDIDRYSKQLTEMNRLKRNQEGLINGTNDLIWSVDTNMCIISANKSFTDRMFAFTGKHLEEGDTLLMEQFGEESRNKWETFYRRSLQGEIYSVHDETSDLLTGKTEYSLLTFTPMYKQNRELFGVACYAKNITTDTLNKQALERSRNDLDKIMNSSLDVICSVDAAGNFVRVNNAAQKIWGYSSELLIGQPFINFVYPADHEKTNKVAAEILSGREVMSFQNRYLGSDGNTVPMEWSAKWDEADQLMYCVARDVTIKLELEKAIASENKRYENLFMQAPAFICILKGPQHIFQMANPDYEKLIGRTDVVGKSVRELLPELEGQGFFEMLDQVYLTGKPFIGSEMPVKLGKSGKDELTEYYINFSYQAYRNVQGKTEGIFVFGTDVTYQVTTRKTIQESETRYKSLIEQATDAIFITDSNLHFIDMNSHAIELFGYSKDEFLALSLSSILLEEEFAAIPLLIGELKEGKTVRSERRMKKKNGETVVMEMSKKMVADGQCIIFGHDLSERIKAENNNLFKAELLNTIGQAVVSTDLDGRINFWNRAAEDIYGWSSQDAIGKNVTGLLVSQQSLMQADGLMKELVDGHAWSGEYDVQSKSGRSFPVLVNNAPLFDVHHRLSGIISVSSDITERKKSMEDLKYTTNRLILATRGAGMGIWDWDITNNHLEWDSSMHRMYDTEIHSFTSLYDEWMSRLHPDDRERVHTDIQMALSGEKEYDTEFRIIWKDSTIHYIRASGMTEKNDLGIATRLIGVNWDVTRQKDREQQLKLLESVIINTNDSVLITETEYLQGHDPRIVYINKAFTTMTGYTAEEVIGKTPKILQGPKTDRKELNRIVQCMKKWQTCEATIVNYRKDKGEFWNNFFLTPVSDETGWYTHWIGIEKDITGRKNKELQKTLLAEISVLFNDNSPLNITLQKVLESISLFGDFRMAEVWLVSSDKKSIKLTAHLPKVKYMDDFYQETSYIKKFAKGDGLPGLTWQSRDIRFWLISEKEVMFVRRQAAIRAGLTAIYGVPLFYNDEVIGVFLLGLHAEEKIPGKFSEFFESLGAHTGIETRRKMLDQELKQIFSFAPDIICIIGWDGYFRKINPAACELFQYSEVELLTIPVVDLVYMEDKPSASVEFRKIKEGKSAHYFENRCVTKFGKIKWLAWTASVSSGEGLIFAVAKDITEKKELENLLNKANSLARIGSWEIDPLVNTLYWSQVTREIHEVDPDFLPDFETAVHFYKEGKDRETIIFHMSQCVQDGIAFDVELKIVTSKGNEKWIRAIGDSEFVNHKCVRVYGSFQDIDIRKRAELAASEVLEEKNIILESIGDGFFAVDRKWNVTYWNNQAEFMLDITKEQIVGLDLLEVFEQKRYPGDFEKYQDAINTRQVVHFETYYRVLEKWFSVGAYPSANGLSVYFRDITESKLSEISLLALNVSIEKHSKELAVSNAELEQFAYVASHDLQEPLRMITGYLTQLEKKYGEDIDERGKKYIFFAVDGAKRMRQIILDLLEFSKVGRTQDKIEDVDLNEIIREIRILFRKQIEEKSAVIHSDQLPVLHSFTSPLRQVFQNLIGNALKYTAKDASVEISISVTESETYWQFEVKDNGIGIEKEYYAKIFVLFQRLHNKDEYSGTGMGLAVTKKIIENLGGRIWVESEEGKGSNFYFTLLKRQRLF